MDYAIAIGGTGSRCLEALIYLCAAGLGPKDLFVLVIDSDSSNGNVMRLKNTVADYTKNRENLGLQKSHVFNTQLRHSDEISWSPLLNIQGEDKSFRELLKYPVLSNESKNICRLFYTDRELKMDMTSGFHGHPSVGAAAMATIKLELDRDPWAMLLNNIRGDLGHGQETKIFVFASIFGGAGASGFPTVGQIINDSIETNRDRFKLGGSLILPYFRFDPTDEELKKLDSEEELYAKAEHFLLYTQAALKYYAFCLSGGDKSPYNTTYLLGEKTPSRRRFAVSGPNQENPAHYIEFLAALAAIDFYRNNKAERYYYAGPRQENYEPPTMDNQIGWEDLPVSDTFRSEIRDRLLFFATFGFAYLDFYLPLLSDRRFEDKKHLVPWYVNYFERKDENLKEISEEGKQKELEHFFNEHFFPWILDIHEFEGIHLLNKDAFSEKDIHSGNFSVQFQKGSVGNLLLPLPGKSVESNAYDKLWQDMCFAKLEPEGKNTGKLVSLLYQASEKFCNSNYQLKRG